MNITIANSSVHKFREAISFKEKLVYGTYLLLGIFFIGSVLFTIMKSLSTIALIGSVPGAIYPIIILYVCAQLLLCYGFLFCKKWIFYILSIHIFYTGASVVLLLPFLGLSHLMQPTAIAATPFILLFLFTLVTRKYCTSTSWQKTAVIFYTIVIGLLVAINTTLSTLTA